MAKRSKSLIFKAREDKARRARLEYETLALALDTAETDEEREVANAALTTYFEEQEQERQKKDVPLHQDRYAHFHDNLNDRVTNL